MNASAKTKAAQRATQIARTLQQPDPDMAATDAEFAAIVPALCSGDRSTKVFPRIKQVRVPRYLDTYARGSISYICNCYRYVHTLLRFPTMTRTRVLIATMSKMNIGSMASPPRLPTPCLDTHSTLYTQPCPIAHTDFIFCSCFLIGTRAHANPGASTLLAH